MNRSSSISTFIIHRMIRLFEEQGWCSHVLAQDEMGNPCLVEDPNAWSFSLMGGLFWVLQRYPQATKFREEIIRQILRTLTARGVETKGATAKSDAWKHAFNQFNDAPGMSRLEVIKMLKEAMEG